MTAFSGAQMLLQWSFGGNMSGVPSSNRQQKEEAIRELLQFVSDFSRLIDKQVSDARGVMLKTVDQMMASVNEISEATDFKLRKADEMLVKESSDKDFVSKSAKEVDARLVDPAARVKAINQKISEHMSTLGHLDDSVRGVLFSIMGAMSMDDVVRQRLEHVTSAALSVETAVRAILEEFSKGTLTPQLATNVKNTLAQKMYKSFTMEDEKAVFKGILGDIKNYQAS